MTHKRTNNGIHTIDNMYSYFKEDTPHYQRKAKTHQYNIYETDSFFNYMIIGSQTHEDSYYDI